MTQTEQYGAALAAGILSSVSLLLMHAFPYRSVFLLVLLLWLLILFFLHRPLFSQGAALALGTTGLFIVVEPELVRWLLILFVGTGMGTLYLWRLRSADGVWYEGKPLRRYTGALWVFAVYGMITFLFALLSFFPLGASTILVLLLMGAVFGVTSLMIWQQYYAVGAAPLFLWTVIVAMVMMELAWSMQLLPLGYTVLGALLTWLWYILQLFIRFHLSPRGIVWRRQLVFLGTNMLLFALLMVLFVRWV